MRNFDTEQQAINAAYRQNTKIADKICPIFKDKCKGKKCMSFQQSRIYSRNTYLPKENTTKLVWNVNIANCGSPLVSGYIEMEVTNI